MGILIKPLILYFLLGFLLFKTGTCANIQVGNDAEFEKFLLSAMNNYSTWLEEQHLDPSPQTSAIMTGLENGVSLDCQISHHQISGHSKTGPDTMSNVTSSFSRYLFEMGRTSPSIFDFNGDFFCSGVLYARYISELQFDIPFSGEGKFHLTANRSIEMLTLRNVGITEEYALDFSKSWTDYMLLATPQAFQLEANWNHAVANSTYFARIEESFSEIYRDYAVMNDEDPTYPAGLLLKRYFHEVVEPVNLRDIMKEEDLPSPYVPTTPPSTTTGVPTTPTTPSSAEKITTTVALYFMLLLFAYHCQS